MKIVDHEAIEIVKKQETERRKDIAVEETTEERDLKERTERKPAKNNAEN